MGHTLNTIFKLIDDEVEQKDFEYRMNRQKSVGEELRCTKCNQYAPDRCTCNQVKDLSELIVGNPYNWIGQQERLIYMGRPTSGGSAYWYQFALVDKPDVCWGEVLAEDMKMLERTKSRAASAI